MRIAKSLRMMCDDRAESSREYIGLTLSLSVAVGEGVYVDIGCGWIETG